MGFLRNTQDFLYKKNQIYILTRAELLYTLCYEIPCITLTFIDDYVLNINDIKEFWSFGICRPLLAFMVFLAYVTLDESFKQKVSFFVKN